ncbi:hypothetical protein ZOSMA_220G00050 [Zostera marina]|uniref:Alpha/beta hydrolase fold-3 domain-containing protein n=1 Tax=Zostera marina TaxID=29655 RepID=A0A0K9PLP3_ZOSMR|nr:hypothetical protein ZOSMA_220G00050 [Zostera marina]
MPMIENNKKLVDEVAGWLRIYDDGSVDQIWMGPSEVEFLVTPYHPSSEEALERDGIVLQDRLITTNDLDVSLRFYMPTTIEKKTTEKLPIILHFQVGGFCISKATWFMYYQFYSHIAIACQAVVISVFTRLAPEYRLPSAIDDGYTALLLLRSLRYRRLILWEINWTSPECSSWEADPVEIWFMKSRLALEGNKKMTVGFGLP